MDQGVDIRVRLTGGKEAAAQAQGVARGVHGIGTAAERTTRQAGLLGRATSGLLAPFKHVEKQALGAAKSFAAAGLAFGSVEGIKHAIESTDELVKTTVSLHNQFGLTIQSASSLGAVLHTRSIDPSSLQMGFRTLSRQMVEASHGGKQAAGAFRQLGFNQAQLRHLVASPDGLNVAFERLSDHLTTMEGSPRKAALGAQLLGRASKGLAPLLQQGALGMKQQEKWARQYGDTLDEKTVKGTEKMVAAQTQAQYAMQGLQIQIGMFAAPLVTKANLALADIVKSFRDGRPEGHKFSKTVYQLGVDLKPVGHDLRVVGGYLKDHPHLLQAAAVAYGAYRLHLLNLLTMAPKAFAKGLLTGRAYRLGFEAGAKGLNAPLPGGPGLPGLPGEKGGRGGLLKTLEKAAKDVAPFALRFARIGGPAASFLLGSGLVGGPFGSDAGWDPKTERQHLHAVRGRSVHNLAAYYGHHPQMLDRASLDALGRRTSYGPDTGGGHFHIYIDGKQVAHVMVDRHGKVIATGVAKAAQDAAARKHR